MIKFAFVAANGEVTATVCPSEDTMFSDGQVVEDQTMRSFDYAQDDSEVCNNWYWRDGWVTTKPPRPSGCHVWENYQWNLDTSALLDEIRQDRDLRLGMSDWTQVPDSPLTAEQRSEWQMYRQRLRDIPSDFSHVTSSEDVIWPSPPTG